MKIARLPDGSPEIFRTLQGEGPSIGCPAIFIRLSLCNLHCSWCDTPFTWNWEATPWEHCDKKKFRKEEQLIEQTSEDLALILKEIVHEGDRLIITGGEPLLQQEALCELLMAVAHQFSAIEVETNGTQVPIAALDQYVHQYNVSPKLANSMNSESLRIKEAAMAFFTDCERAFYKFVITQDEDLVEVLSLQERFGISSQQISLMPEGRTPQALAQGRSRLAQICLEKGFRLTDRLHVQLWGDERGR